jgi:hypothetical protein
VCATAALRPIAGPFWLNTIHAIHDVPRGQSGGENDDVPSGHFDGNHRVVNLLFSHVILKIPPARCLIADMIMGSEDS